MIDLLTLAVHACVEAGKAILRIYSSEDFGVEMKSDNSPLTKADRAAHEIISNILLNSNIPVLSEEGSHDDYSIRKQWIKLWIVDPLDGTKEFVKRTGEFTVNIALVEDGYPVLGVVFVPVQGLLYYGSEGKSFKMDLGSEWTGLSLDEVLNTKKMEIKAFSDSTKLGIVASVSHLSEETKRFAEILKDAYGETDFSSIGSSLKICKVAEGSADVYPRLGATMEWDTAAGQAVAENAGAFFLNWKTKNRFDYNRELLLNDWFVVAGSKVDKDTLVQLMKKSGL